MSNPNFVPSPVNRLIASVIWDSFTSLNVTPQFLLPEAINLSFDGQSVTNLPALTSIVPSLEPYIPVSLMFHIVRTTSLAQAYKTQMELNSYLGNCTVRADTTNVGPWSLMNMSIVKVSPLAFTGRDAGFVVTCSGTYAINNSLWP